MCINLSRPLDVDCLFKCLLPAFFLTVKQKNTKNNEKNQIACGYKPSVYGKKKKTKCMPRSIFNDFIFSYCKKL